MTATAVKKYLQDKINTVKDHIKLNNKNKQSTKIKMKIHWKKQQLQLQKPNRIMHTSNTMKQRCITKNTQTKLKNFLITPVVAFNISSFTMINVGYSCRYYIPN